MDTVSLSPWTRLRNGFHLEPRCRVCRNNVVREKVNALLASGASYALVRRALEDDNTELDKRDRVTIDSIRSHTARHFPVQQIAGATYREILERRAQDCHRSVRLDRIQSQSTVHAGERLPHR